MVQLGDHLRSGIISGPTWGSFTVRNHLWSNLENIYGPGSFVVQLGDHLRSGIICGPTWRSFIVRDHLWSNLEIIYGPGSFEVQLGDHGPGDFRSGFIDLRTSGASLHSTKNSEIFETGMRKSFSEKFFELKICSPPTFLRYSVDRDSHIAHTGADRLSNL